jgi:hypothetical protein
MIRQKWLLSKNYHTWLEIYEQGWQNPYLLDPNRTQPVLQFLRIAEQVQGRQEELQMRIVQLAQANGLGTTIANGRLWETIQKARILYRKIRLKAGLN